MATTPLGGRLPNVNRKGSSPCVGGSSSSSGSATSQRKQQQQERTGRDHHHHHHHHHHRHHQSKSGQSHHHHHHHAQQTHRKDQKQPERTQIQQEPNHQSSTVAAHAGELDPAATNATNNFEYDDNEWDIGIGDLIIDLDADIEKTRDEKLSAGTGMASTPASAAATTNHLNSASSSNSPSSSNGQFSSSSGSSNSGTCSQGNGSNSNSGANSSIASVGGASNKQQVAGVNSAAHPNQGNPAKMAVEHSATVDKGLKMKIKRTKPGTKSSEAKHEIVKSNELNGTVSAQDAANCSSNSSSNSASMSASSPGQGQMQNATQDSQTQSGQSKSKPTHQQTGNTATSGASVSTNTGSKRGSSGHRRDKARDKHDKQPQSNHQSQQSKPEINGSIRPIMQNHAGSATSQNPGSGQSIGSPPTTSTSSASSSCSSSTSSAPSGAYSNSASPGASSSSAIAAIAGSNAGQQQGPTPAATAPQQQQPPGPPPSSRTGGFSVSQGSSSNGAAAPCPPASPASATAAAGSASKPEQTKVATVPGAPTIGSMPDDSIDMAASPPPSKKMKISPKNEPKDMSDMCVGTSVGTITEPECLGPCEPGTSVTLEGIVWHETEGGVLVVNVTWRGKTYVGTLLDCTRHDWAPPRFCDSPTSDLDARTPKGRGKRGRAAANATPGNDLSNFTETRSSVHSKLRNGGAKGRRGAQGSPAASPSPAAFVPPRPDPAAKRKPRGPEEEEKSKRRAPPPTPPSGSPPASPVLLECPEPNCSKKYKHINGLKYHQSHAHGSADDEDTKEGITSMSENDESNIEAPSPATPVKSPPDAKTETCTPVRVASPPSTLPPETPPRVPSPGVEAPADKSIVKPGVLRFGQDAEQRTVQPSTPSAPAIVTPSPPSPGPRQSPRPVPSPHIPQPITIPQPPQPSQNLIMQQSPQMTVQSSAQPQPAVPVVHQMQPLPAHSQAQVHMQNQPLPPTPPTSQPIQTMSPLQSLANQMPPTPGLTGSSSSHLQSYPGVGLHTKIPQFKVKPTAALMPEQDKSKDPRATKPQGYKKKSRKSPGGSPHPPMETPMVDNTREDVQSPAYSDISDDGAPVLEAESADKSLKQGQDKDTKAPPPSHIPAHFGIYPYYGQPPPYLVPSVQQQSEKQPGDSSKPSDLATKPDPGKTLNVPQMPSMTSLQSLAAAAGEKDKKELNSPQAQAQAQPPQPHYYGSYGAYMPSSYPYPPSQPAQAHQNQQDDAHDQKKIKQEPQHTIKDKQHENHGIIKDGMELKMSPYGMFHRTAPSERSVPPANAPLPPDDRRYYLYPGEQRRKEETKPSQQVKPPPPSPKHQSKSGQPVQDKPQDLKSDEKIKQEGVKPTMETQGPPPPPTSQYAYIHPGYMPPQHYGALSFDPSHPMYRGISPMLVPGPYTGGPYLHQIPRYHGPEDLSRPPGKALELLQHHASQYYTAHKIHELQERALKSPTPKSSATSASPSAPSANPSRPPSGPPSSAPGPGPPQLPPGQTQSGKQPPSGSQSQPPQSQQAPPGGNASEKESRSPPPQRHVHTHHHTHVGLGYPLLPGQYPASYGAAVLASQQAAAVAASVISPFPPK